MRNLTLSIDERTLEAARRHAKARGISLNALVRELLEQMAGSGGVSRLDQSFALAKELRISSTGKRWSREELYDPKRIGLE